MISRAISRVLRERHYLGTGPNLVVRAYDELLFKRDWDLPFRSTTVRIRLPTEPAPLYLRLGTTDFWTLNEIFGDEIYKPILGMVDPRSRLVLDLGSNVGYSVRYWLPRFPSCKVIAMEPDPGNAEIFRRNIASAGAGARVSLHEACATVRTGEVWLTQGKFSNSFQVSTGERLGSIRVRGLDIGTVLAGVAEVDLLKCDIEGAEGQLFKSCGPWIGKIRTIVVELHPPYSLEELVGDIFQAGARFNVVRHDPVPSSQLTVAFLSRAN